VNIKKGLERVWIFVSVLWVVGIIGVSVFGINYFDLDKGETEFIYFVGVICLFVWWGLLYTGFWISSGFSGDDKKKGETDE
jgi:hypothetical protein